MLVVASVFRFNWDMSIEEAVELARRAIYHATFRDGASGGVVSGKQCLFLFFCRWLMTCLTYPIALSGGAAHYTLNLE